MALSHQTLIERRDFAAMVWDSLPPSLRWTAVDTPVSFRWIGQAEAWTLSEIPLQPSARRIADRLNIDLDDLDQAFLEHRGLPTAESLRNLRLDYVSRIVRRRPALALGEATHLAGYRRRSAFYDDYALRTGAPPRAWWRERAHRR